MSKHAFIDPADYTKGGTWFGDYGRHFCRWTWDPTKQVLDVICGADGKHVEVAKLPPSGEPLELRLPLLALEAAERITVEQRASCR
jgi:hypothetical protein